MKIIFPYMIYHKPAITYEAQIQQLEGRELQIPDHDLAKHYLAHVGYYRLAGYLVASPIG